MLDGNAFRGAHQVRAMERALPTFIFCGLAALHCWEHRRIDPEVEVLGCRYRVEDVQREALVRSG